MALPASAPYAHNAKAKESGVRATPMFLVRKSSGGSAENAVTDSLTETTLRTQKKQLK
jgi:hypothetical protein